MKRTLLIFAPLLAPLAAAFGPATPGAAPAGPALGDEAPVPSGPVRRRPPEQRTGPSEHVPDARDATGALEDPDPPVADADPGPPSVIEVLDASFLEGVFASYAIRDGREIPEPLTGAPGDAVAGRRLFHNFSRTGCSLCHGTAEMPREPDSERTAPPLHRIAERLSPARIRLWIVAPETIRPGTEMPAFHKPLQRTDPHDPLYGGPRLTAAEVEDIVAYLSGAGMDEAD